MASESAKLTSQNGISTSLWLVGYRSSLEPWCHWDQNFGIPYFCIFENSLWLLVTMPNFSSLRRLEVAFFGQFLSRFYCRHYWPLFRKLAWELAEVTLEAHLKPSTFIRLLAVGNLTVVEGRFLANCLLYGLEIFVAAAVIKCITWNVLYNATTINPTIELVFCFNHQSLASGPAMEKWIMFVLTHSANFNLRGIFVGCSDHFTDERSRGLFTSKDPRGQLFHCQFQLYGKKIRKKWDERYLILTHSKW